MLPLDVLVTRIRGEFREMPGLSLTFEQACRLWQIDAATCRSILQALLLEGFLVQRANAYSAVSSRSEPLSAERDPGRAVARP
jgi:hypothetical protein